MIRRAGYAVYMLPSLGGSYEECPPSLIDLSTRDRRWCQGNLQHLRVLFAKGLHPMSRQHFVTGIMAYVASPLWMAQLLVGIVLVLQASYIRPEYFPSDFTLFPAWPRFDPQRSLELFAITMTILLLPKFFGLALCLDPKRHPAGCRRRDPGSSLSALFEIIMSALARSDHDADPDGPRHAFRVRPRYRLGPAAARRRLDSLQGHRASPPRRMS